jgi:sRNA-binding protein
MDLPLCHRYRVTAGELWRAGKAQILRNLLDSAAHFPNSGRSMGKHDNRTSMKMRRRKAQKKLKARVKRQRTEKKASRTGAAKSAKKPRTTPAPAKE